MTEPISLAEAKQHLRVEAAEVADDALITSLIVAAREWVENRTDHILVQRALTEYVANFGSYIEIDRRPLVSVTSIAYTDADGVAQSYAGFVVANGIYPVKVYPAHDASWPAMRANTLAVVTYTAGYANAAAVPQALKQAVLLLIGHWHANREGVVVGSTANDVPLAVDSLCQPFRRPV